MENTNVVSQEAETKDVAQIIASVSMKGGVGKTTLSILIAKNLAARGYKVLYFDLDPNNSGTMHFTVGIDGIAETIELKNVFEALSHNSIKGYTIPSNCQKIDIVPSHLNIYKLRGIGYNELAKTLRNCTEYDYVVIDTAPTYDNIIINALTAADVILTPLHFSSFDLTTTHFLQKQIYDDVPQKINNWYLVYTAWEEKFTKFASSMQMQFVSAFESQFSNILDIHIPTTPAAKNYTQITGAKVSVNDSAIGSRRLATEINKLCNMLTGSSDEKDYVEKF